MRYWLTIPLALATSSAMADCQLPTEPLSGRMGLLETRHPNGDTIKGWVLLTSDVCVRMENFDGDMVDFAPRIVHVVFAPGKEPRNLMASTSGALAVRGDLMEAHTIWHLGDVVMTDAELLP